jgi:hypothetical protein
LTSCVGARFDQIRKLRATAEVSWRNPNDDWKKLNEASSDDRQSPKSSRMTLQDAAFALAGAIGGGTALVHGRVLQRRFINPLMPVMRGDKGVPGHISRLVPVLLHFSTFNWLVGGIALIAVGVWFGPPARMATGLIVGSSYLFGTIGNFWVSRGRHPGWVLFAAALCLIAIGLT